MAFPWKNPWKNVPHVGGFIDDVNTALDPANAVQWSSMVGYGLLSARPAAGVLARLYYATDTSTWYRDNGATWDATTAPTPTLFANEYVTTQDASVGAGRQTVIDSVYEIGAGFATEVAASGVLSVLELASIPYAPRDWGRVTALPAYPGDGDTCVLVDSLTAATYAWPLVYVAGSSNADKWECVGGSAAFIAVEAAQGTTSATATDLGTDGPTFTTPRPGVYQIDFECDSTTGVAISVNNPVYLFVNGVEATRHITRLQNGWQSTVHAMWQAAGVGAAQVIKMRYSSDGTNTITFSRRRMRVVPVRLS